MFKVFIIGGQPQRYPRVFGNWLYPTQHQNYTPNYNIICWFLFLHRSQRDENRKPEYNDKLPDF